MSGIRFKDGKWYASPEIDQLSYWEDYKPQPNRKERRAEAAKKRRKR